MKRVIHLLGSDNGVAVRVDVRIETKPFRLSRGETESVTAALRREIMLAMEKTPYAGMRVGENIEVVR